MVCETAKRFTAQTFTSKQQNYYSKGFIEEADVPWKTDGYKAATADFDGIEYDGKDPLGYLKKHKIEHKSKNDKVCMSDLDNESLLTPVEKETTEPMEDNTTEETNDAVTLPTVTKNARKSAGQRRKAIIALRLKHALLKAIDTTAWVSWAFVGSTMVKSQSTAEEIGQFVVIPIIGNSLIYWDKVCIPSHIKTRLARFLLAKS